MGISSFVGNIRDKYVAEYLENASKVDYSEVDAKYRPFSVLYKDLPDADINGYPFASDFVAPDGAVYTVDRLSSLSEERKKQCKLRFHYMPYAHEIYIGATGSGKTTGCVEPQLRAISSQKNKPNLFITDPKGELFDRNAEHLKEQGYNLFVLNFKDLIRSDKWNPLYELYDLKMKINDLGKGYKVHPYPIREGLEVLGSGQGQNGKYIEYEGKAFITKKDFTNYLVYRKDFIEATIDDLINQIANMMITVQSNTDKSWEYGSQDLLKGIIQCMLEDAIDPYSGFTKEMMTMRTLQQYYLALKLPILDGSSNTSLSNHPLLSNKTGKPMALMSTALANAGNTMRSYCGVFDGAVKDWFQGHIFALTTGNTVSLESPDGKPFAIFLITRDYEKSDFLIAGLFIDWVYRQMLERAEKNPDSHPLHFLLDEFGNIPAIKDFENKISTARSRNIWFHLALQSYSQLSRSYDDKTAEIIKDNCVQIFLGSTNSSTKELFSRACGQHTVPTLESQINPSDNSVQVVPLVPVSALNELPVGKMFILRDKMPVIVSQYIRSYMCAEQGSFKHFFDSNGLKTCTPVSTESYTAPKYTYAKLSKGLPSEKNMFEDMEIDGWDDADSEGDANQDIFDLDELEEMLSTVSFDSDDTDF